MMALPLTDVYASFESSFAAATGVPEEDVTVVSMTVGGEDVAFSGRRLEDTTSVEVTYEIEVQDEAASAVVTGIADDIETYQADLATALVSEVATSLEITDMVAEAAPAGVTPETPSPTPEPTSSAYVAALALALLY